MRPDSAAFLWDALDAVKAVRDFTAGADFEGYAGDLKLRSAVERQFEILGEALNNLRKTDPDTAARVPEVEKIIGMRNVIAHEYGSVDQVLLWAAVERRVPRLIDVLTALLAEADEA